MSELVPSEPPELRLSDEEREKVAEFLRGQASEGRISLDELEERLGSVYSARVRGDLAGITADLPVPAAPIPAAASGPPVRQSSTNPGFRRHLEIWCPVTAAWILAWVLWGLTIIPVLIWTCVLFLHWLRVQSA